MRLKDRRCRGVPVRKTGRVCRGMRAETRTTMHNQEEGNE